jgi:hypothetical protein
MARWAMPVLCLALLGIGGATFWQLVRGSPAFAPAHRVAGPFGDWRVPLAQAHFDRAEYFRQSGEGYLRADLLLGADGGDALADAAQAAARAAQAEELLRRSLQLAPADAFTWASLAWAQAIRERVGDARRAMETSWSLAPYNAPLAMTRLAFAEFLAAAVIAPDAGALTTGEMRGIGRDIATLARFKPGLAETILAASPAIAEVHAKALAE